MRIVLRRRATKLDLFLKNVVNILQRLQKGKWENCHCFYEREGYIPSVSEDGLLEMQIHNFPYIVLDGTSGS